MSPRPRLPKTQWADDSIRVEVKSAGLADEPENQKVFEACLGELNAVKFRLMLGLEAIVFVAIKIALRLEAGQLMLKHQLCLL